MVVSLTHARTALVACRAMLRERPCCTLAHSAVVDLPGAAVITIVEVHTIHYRLLASVHLHGTPITYSKSISKPSPSS